MLQILVFPIAVLYVINVRIRLLLFRNTLRFHYLPKEYSTIVYPVVLDSFWLKNGAKGLGLVNIPKGHPSLRYDEESPWWESWIGRYLITFTKQRSFTSDLQLVTYVAQCALEDQREWLKMFDRHHTKVHLLEDTLSLIEEKKLANGKELKIYFGKIQTDVDDHNKKHSTPFVLRVAGDLTAKIFNRKNMLDCSINLDSKVSRLSEITLEGYWGVLEKSKSKYEVVYAAVRSDADVLNELLRTIQSADV